MQIIVDNLKSDTTQPSFIINGNTVRALMIDNLIAQKQYDMTDSNVLKQINFFIKNVSPTMSFILMMPHLSK